MSSEVLSRQVYRLGEVVFSLENCNAEFERDLDCLLPHVEVAPDEDSIRHIKMGCVQDLRELVNHVLKRHKGNLWMDAACIVSPGGKTVLLSGKSGSGKSTTALAFALSRGWKVLAEDITLLNVETNEVINFASPFSLKKGTADLVTKTTATETPNTVLGEWIALGNHSAGRNFPLPFDVAIHLELDDKTAPMNCQHISDAQYVRCILPHSNAIRLSDGMDKMLDYVRSSKCFQISGGSLEDRMNKIEEICDQLSSAKFAAVPPPEPASDDEAESEFEQACLDQRYKRHPEVESKVLPDGHLVVFNEKTNWAQTLNPVGAVIWEFCDGTATVREILKEIGELSEASVAPEFEQQVLALVDELLDAGLVEPVEV